MATKLWEGAAEVAGDHYAGAATQVFTVEGAFSGTFYLEINVSGTSSDTEPTPGSA